MVRLMNGFVLEEDGSICGLGGIGGTAGGRVSDEKSWDVRLEPVGVAWVEVARVRGGESLGEAVSVGWAVNRNNQSRNIVRHYRRQVFAAVVYKAPSKWQRGGGGLPSP